MATQESAGDARRDAERFLSDSRRARRGSPWKNLPLYAAALIFLVVLVPNVRRLIARQRDAAEPRELAPSMTFRGRTYSACLDPDRTVEWAPGGASDALALSSQVALARALFPVLERSLRSAAVELKRTHASWFENRAITAARLGAELRVTALRVPPDVRDVTILASHPVFSGHVVEIALTRAGAVTYVGLLG